MRLRLFVAIPVLLLSLCAHAGVDAVSVDRSISGKSEHPVATVPAKVGTYPGFVSSGAGYFYDDVLEYRVWLNPENGAEKKKGGSDYFVAFAQYEHALEFSRRSKGAEKPLVLIRQLKHVNEPRPGVFEVVSGERLTEWQVQWLAGAKRTPGAIEKFMAEHKK
ncbi:MAG TPA: GCN5 family acetyltransferase [Pseudoduganella sp.]